MNILILAAGKPSSESSDTYPLCLTEIDGVPLLEKIVSACAKLSMSNIIFALRAEDVRRHHLDNVVKLLLPEAKIITVSDRVLGAACTALLAAEHINNDEELLIVNGDSLIDISYDCVLEEFKDRNLHAGTVTFPSVHPRYSYVRLDESGLVVEAAEKNPISRHATAGFYWYSKGRDFVCAAQGMIRKDANVGGHFFICPAFNQLVLEHAKIGIYEIDAKQYHQLKTEKQLSHYEATLDHARYA
jgi:NDP-sugar pyrophosphorylase family protein